MLVHPPMVRFACFWVCLIAGTLARAQSTAIWFKHLSVEEGLASTHVECMLQDSKGFMWFGTWKGLCRYDGYQFKTYRHDPDDSLSISSDAVFCLFEDHEGVLWVGSRGLERFNPETETFTHYLNKPVDSSSAKAPTIFSLCEDQKGRLWVGSRQGLFRFQKETKEYVRYVNNPADPGSLSDNLILTLCPDSNGALWIGTMNGLNRFDPIAEKFQRFSNQPGDPSPSAAIGNTRISKIVKGADGLLYIGTTAGLFICDPRNTGLRFARVFNSISALLQDKNNGSWWLGTGSGLFHTLRPGFADMEKYVSHVAQLDGLSSSLITALIQDREGTIWIGTENGINLLPPEAFQFRQYKTRYDDPNSLSDNLVYSVIESRDHTVWMGVNNGGLNCLDPATGIVRRYPSDKPGSPYSTNNRAVFRVYEDRFGRIWAGLPSGGLDRLDRRTSTFTHFQWGDFRDLVSFFYEDKDSTLWIGHQGGVSRFDHRTQQFEFAHYAPEVAGKRMVGVVTGILQDHTGVYWVSSNGYYLNQFDPETMRYKRFLPDPKNPGSISSNDIQAIYEDHKGQLWAGANNGLNLFDRQKGTFRHFDLKNGLPHLMMGHMLEDGRGYLWIATGEGISRFDPRTETFRNYDKLDGLSSNESWDFIKSPYSGAFLLATANGLTIFHPDSLRDNTVAPPLVFTKFTRFNAQTGKQVEEKGITEKTELTLSYLDDILTIEFAALSFRKTAKNQYAYQLEGFRDDWVQLGTKHDITFTDLSPGHYWLRVKASNGDGVWNEAGTALKIIILPPFWATWWAYLLYAAAFSYLMFLAYRFQLNRKLAAAENLRLKELDSVKTRLYTNITHEFRTPLTVITGMADQIAENPKRWLVEGVQAIKHNAGQLLRLVNQMLDLRKLEAGKMTLQLVHGDVVAYLKYLVESFHSLAHARHIELRFDAALPVLLMDYDPDKLQQITTNLLSNALKFTPAGGAVTVAVGHGPLPQTMALRVKDTGIGILPEKQPYIFDLFYQADDTHTRPGEGTGIGLALTKELVHLSGGEISVQSEPGKGAEFTVILPVTSTAGRSVSSTDPAPIPVPMLEMYTFPDYNNPDTTNALETGADEPPMTTNRSQVLIVEDNPDVVRYLRMCLEAEYLLHTARDGRQGIAKAIELVPDLIISDVMMPGTDGFELCDTLKNDERTSHIPIILLTAKADVESRLEGLSSGADAYLAKPFNKNELLIRTKKLLELRQKLQKYYLLGATGGAGRIAAEQLPEVENKEEAFVRNIRVVVEAHLGDSRFSMTELCREVAMSRSQLHRKLTALTGLSPNPFIRYLRLEKARQLLAETDRPIADIAYETGFNDPDYFARIFSKSYGLTPSEHRALAKKEGRGK